MRPASDPAVLQDRLERRPGHTHGQNQGQTQGQRAHIHLHFLEKNLLLLLLLLLLFLPVIFPPSLSAALGPYRDQDSPALYTEERGGGGVARRMGRGAPEQSWENPLLQRSTSTIV